MYHRYMSFAPRFMVLVSEEMREVASDASDGNAARSSVSTAFCVFIVPRRLMRRPDWSWFRMRVNVNFGSRASASALVSDWRMSELVILSLPEAQGGRMIHTKGELW